MLHGTRDQRHLHFLRCLRRLLPRVPTEEEQPVGVLGQRHRQYLKEHRLALYNALLLSGKLND